MKKHANALTPEQTAIRVSIITIIMNAALTVFKLIAGFLAHSSAMISDGIHSASDVGSTLIVMAGIKISGKKSDIDHPYGHERLECVSAILLSGLLLATGIMIGYDGLQDIIHGNPEAAIIPGMPALIAAVISLLTKEGMFQYTRKAARQINSGALMADAWHHRSDALSSVGAFVGILGARMGYPVMDSLASLVICLFIVKAAYDIFMDAINKMVDHSCDSQTEENMLNAIRGVPGVIKVDMLHTRLFGAAVYVDCEISADQTLPLGEAHKIAEEVHHTIEKQFTTVKHCMVHVNPASAA